jgi:microcystin degradation protein MlrC
MIATAARARQSAARGPFAAPIRGRRMERLVAMARIAIGGLHHETNSFAPQVATFERFVEADGWPPLLRGKAMLPGCAGINLAITGFADAARAAGHELVPLLWANSCPSGPVTEDAFERLAAMLVEDLVAAGPLDGLFLDLHGAMVTEHLEDGEGELLRRLRASAPRLPIVAALDLHANLSAAMVELSEALVAYRTYPHIDLAATGARCLAPLERAIAGERPAKAWRRMGFLVPLPWQCTTIEPGRGLYALLAELEANGVASASICMGFPAADTPVCGPAVLAYAADAATADAAADRLAAAFDAAEPRFAGKLWDAADAVAYAKAAATDRTLILADTQDNPGGGGSSDTTGLLAALIEARAEGALLALLCDPDAAATAHRAGVGAVLHGLALGGRHGPDGVGPLIGGFEVLRLGDGRFTATGPMYGGNRMELGPMALLRSRAAPGVEIAIASRRLQAADRAILKHLGVDPAAKRLLALKSSVHFRADFEALADEILVVAAPGANIADPAQLPFRRLPATMRRHPAAS